MNHLRTAPLNTTQFAPVPSTQTTLTAWEDIIEWRALYLDVDTKVYHTDASDINKINFVWFAFETITTGNPVLIDVSWVNRSQWLLSEWSDYFLANWVWWLISLTTWDNLVKVGKAMTSTVISIFPLWETFLWIKNVDVTDLTKTLALSDMGTRQRCINALSQTITIDTNANVPFPLWTEITVLQSGAWQVIIEGAVWVTINWIVTWAEWLQRQYQSVVLLKVGTDEWELSWDI